MNSRYKASKRGNASSRPGCVLVIVVILYGTILGSSSTCRRKRPGRSATLTHPRRWATRVAPSSLIITLRCVQSLSPIARGRY